MYMATHPETYLTEGNSDRPVWMLDATITNVTMEGCCRRWCCCKESSCELTLDTMYNIEFSEVPHPKDGKPFTFDPPERSVVRNAISWIITTLLILCVIMTNFVLIFLRIKWTLLDDDDGNGGSKPDTSSTAMILGFLVTFLTAIIITIFNELYATIALRLTEFENHKTESSFQQSRILKVFMFYFISSYFSLFYTAFAKTANQKIFGYGPDVCMENPISGDDNDCMYELSYAVLLLYVSMIVVGNIFEVGFGKLQTEITKCLLGCCHCCCSDAWVKDFKRKNLESRDKSCLMQQFYLDQYPGTFDDFAELIIQFGYVTLFAVAFPLSPVLALANNYFIEWHLDKNKLLFWRSRSNLVGAQDIGAWMGILEVMGFLTVTTNVAICIFTSGAFDNTLSTSSRMLWFGVIEHAIIILRIALSYFIPDRNGDVVVQMKRQAFLTENLLSLKWEDETKALVEDAVATKVESKKDM